MAMCGHRVGGYVKEGAERDVRGDGMRAARSDIKLPAISRNEIHIELVMDWRKKGRSR